MNDHEGNRLWDVHDVSAHLGIPVNTLYRWRQHNYGPPARRIGRHLRYKQTDVTAWVDTLDVAV